jgi:hypothetical protein
MGAAQTRGEGAYRGIKSEKEIRKYSISNLLKI